MTADVSLGIVVVNFHSTADIRDRLTDLAGLDAHWVLVDNGTDPAAVEELAASVGGTAVLQGSNTGFAAGVNAGVAALPPVDDVLVLNPDVVVTPDQVRALAAARRELGADAVAPLLREPSGRLQVGAAGERISLWSTVAYFGMLAHVLPVRGLMWTRRQSQEGGRAGWLCAACLLLAPDAFARFGPIPTDEVVYAEDVAWGDSATRQGARLFLVQAVTVGHRVGGSGGGDAWVGSLERLLRRRLGAVAGLLAVLVMRAGLLVRRLGRKRGPVHDEVWAGLGVQDADWAVLTEPGRRGGGWDGALDEFYASGRADVDTVLETLAGLGAEDPRTALDFGCGTGRLSFALARRVDHVRSIDVSPAMLATVRERAAGFGLTHVEPVHSDAWVPSADRDLALSLLVLQHLPSPTAALGAVGRMAASVRPGGWVVAELPVASAGWRQRVQPKFRLFQLGRLLGRSPAWLQQRGLSGISMVVVPDAAVTATLTAAGAQVVHREDRVDHDYTYRRYFARLS